MLSKNILSTAILAVLEQLHIDGKYFITVYASHFYNDTEGKLTSMEGKLLYLVFGVSKFYHYPASSKFAIVTDNFAF